VYGLAPIDLIRSVFVHFCTDRTLRPTGYYTSFVLWRPRVKTWDLTGTVRSDWGFRTLPQSLNANGGTYLQVRPLPLFPGTNIYLFFVRYLPYHSTYPHLHLVPRLRMSGPIAEHPPVCLCGVDRNIHTFTLPNDSIERRPKSVSYRYALAA
jgi:hypothetical protein